MYLRRSIRVKVKVTTTSPNKMKITARFRPLGPSDGLFIGMSLPTKEAVGIIPFLRLIEVEAVEPTLLRFRDLERTIEALQQRCRAGDSHVGEQPIDQNRDATKGSLQIGVLTARKLPGRHLDKDNVGRLRFGMDAVSDDLRSRCHQRKLSGIAIVDVRGSDAGE